MRKPKAPVKEPPILSEQNGQLCVNGFPAYIYTVVDDEPAWRFTTLSEALGKTIWWMPGTGAFTRLEYYDLPEDATLALAIIEELPKGKARDLAEKLTAQCLKNGQFVGQTRRTP